LPKKTLPAELGVLCEALTRLINVDGAVVATLMSSRARELVYASDAVARQIDDLQFAVGEGPCLDAYTSQWPQLCPRIDAAGPRRRWLAFSAGVRELGVEAVYVASGVVALQLDVSVDEGLARVRAHAYAYDLAITAAAADIVAGWLSLSANGEP
jgi:hypothetical protein